MTKLLFDAPWWLPTLLLGAGIVLFWNGNRRGESKLRNTGLMVFAAGVAVMAISYFLDTDEERAVKQTKQLVYSVEKRDWATLKNVLDPLTALMALGGIEIYGTRDEIIGGAQTAVDQYGLKNVRILSTTAEQTDTVINITMTLLSEQDATSARPITTTWQFEWQQTGDAWSLVRITNISIGSLKGEAAGRQFPRPRSAQ